MRCRSAHANLPHPLSKQGPVIYNTRSSTAIDAYSIMSGSRELGQRCFASQFSPATNHSRAKSHHQPITLHEPSASFSIVSVRVEYSCSFGRVIEAVTRAKSGARVGMDGRIETKKGRKRLFSVSHAVFLTYTSKQSGTQAAQGLPHGSLLHNATYSTQSSKSILFYSTPAAYSTRRILAPLRFAVFFFLFPLSNATALAWSLPTLSRSLTL